MEKLRLDPDVWFARLKGWAARSGWGRLVVGGLALALVIAYVYIAGELFSGARLYATGTVRPAILEECLAEWPSLTRGQWNITLSARTSVAPEPMSILWCTPASAGEKVLVIYSASAQHGVAVRGRANVFNVLLAEYGWFLPEYLLYMACVAIVVLYQLVRLVQFTATTIQVAFEKAFHSERREAVRAAHVAEFVSDALLLAFFLLLLGVFLYAMGRSLLFSPITQPLVYGFFSAGVLFVCCSPAPRWLIGWVWKTSKSPWMVIARNLVTSGLLLLAILNACSHLKTEDPTAPKTLTQIVWEFVKGAIGL